MRTDLFASPLFVFSVVLLLVNDWILKAAFHNWLTGKLSDFAGLVAVTLFACALAPQRRWLLAVLISAGFIYWKSPYSQGAIDGANTALPFPIGRTVDYGDLLALPAAWLAAAIAPRMRALPIGAWLRYAFALTALVAFTGTSTIYNHQHREVLELSADAGIGTAELQELIDGVAARHGLSCTICDPLASGRRYGDGRLHHLGLVVRLDGGRLFYDAYSMHTDSRLVKRQEVDVLRADLETQLRSRYPGISTHQAETQRLVTRYVRVYSGRAFESSRYDGNVRDYERVRELLAGSAQRFGMTAGPLGDFYYSGRLLGRDNFERELTVRIWNADSALAVIEVRSQSEESIGAQDRLVQEIGDRMRAEFGEKRVR